MIHHYCDRCEVELQGKIPGWRLALSYEDDHGRTRFLEGEYCSACLDLGVAHFRSVAFGYPAATSPERTP